MAGTRGKPEAPRGSGGGRRSERPRDEGGALHGLVGSGPSRVGVSGSMRARDVSRPRPEDVSTAERAAEQAAEHARSRSSGRANDSPGDQSGSGGNEPSSS